MNQYVFMKKELDNAKKKYVEKAILEIYLLKM